MKKIFYLFVILIFSPVVGFSQTSGQTEAADTIAVEITFEKTVHDFGTLEYAEDASIQFNFENTGKEPLVIKRVKSSCGCTVPEWSKEPINMGKKGFIKLKYNTHTQGRFTKSVHVYSNAKNSPVMLTIKGEVIKSSK